MAIMPLGTGNDLARCMGWGGVFSDEPISQLMQAILHETIVTHLDRLVILFFLFCLIKCIKLFISGGELMWSRTLLVIWKRKMMECSQHFH